jgi:hypothetical protein
MWALHPSHEQPNKLVVSLPTFHVRGPLPTHALHCHVQEDKRNKHRTELDLGGGAGGRCVGDSISLETQSTFTGAQYVIPQNKDR